MESNVIFSLIGVAIGAAIPLVKDFLQARNQRAIEIIKLHDKDKMNAYRHLLVYARTLTVITWPDNSSVYSDFKDSCKKEITKLVEFYPYYSKAVMKILDEIENLYHMTIIDADWTIPPKDVIEKKLPELSNKLYKQVTDDFKKWNY